MDAEQQTAEGIPLTQEQRDRLWDELYWQYNWAIVNRQGGYWFPYGYTKDDMFANLYAAWESIARVFRYRGPDPSKIEEAFKKYYGWAIHNHLIGTRKKIQKQMKEVPESQLPRTSEDEPRTLEDLEQPTDQPTEQEQIEAKIQHERFVNWYQSLEKPFDEIVPFIIQEYRYGNAAKMWDEVKKRWSLDRSFVTEYLKKNKELLDLLKVYLNRKK